MPIIIYDTFHALLKKVCKKSIPTSRNSMWFQKSASVIFPFIKFPVEKNVMKVSRPHSIEVRGNNKLKWNFLQTRHWQVHKQIYSPCSTPTDQPMTHYINNIDRDVRSIQDHYGLARVYYSRVKIIIIFCMWILMSTSFCLTCHCRKVYSMT